MKKLICLAVPVLSQEFDILIPDFLEIDVLVSIIAEAVENLSEHLYTPSGHEILCSAEMNKPLSGRSTLADYSIENGAKLILL